MSFTINLSGKDLSTIVAGFTAYDRNISQNWTNVLSDAGNKRYGQDFIRNYASAKQLTIAFDVYGLSDDFSQARNAINEIMDTDVPISLFFGDEPSKIYEVLPDGQSTFVEDHNSMTAKGTLTFLIPKGYAESLQYALLTNTSLDTTYGTVTSLSGSNLKVITKNNGSKETYPKLKITMTSESGYLGIVNENGILEVGDVEESDTQPYQRSEVLGDYMTDIGLSTLFNTSTKNQGILNDNTCVEDNTLGIVNVFERPHIALISRGGTSGQHVGTLTIPVGTDSSGSSTSLNEYIWWRQVFWAADSMEQGFLKLTVSGENNEFLYGVETYKRSNGLRCEYNFMASDGNGSYTILDRKSFLCTHLDEHNPFNATRGWSDIMRRDDQLQFYWWGSYPKFTVPALKGKKSKKIHIAIGSIGNINEVTRAYFDQLLYRKDFVSGFEDVPNRYAAGSVIEIDMAKASVLVNGKPKLTDVVRGSNFPSIPKGESELDIYTSSFCKSPPKIEVSWKENY